MTKRRVEYTFTCSICKRECSYNELGREHPATCMKCFWKEVGYIPLTEEEVKRWMKDGVIWGEKTRK